MFICRRCLLRAPKRLQAPLLFTRTFKAEALYISNRKKVANGEITIPVQPPLHITRDPQDSSGLSERKEEQQEAKLLTWSLPLSEEERQERRRKHRHWRSHPIPAYFEQRNKDKCLIAYTPFYALRWVIKEALARGRSDYLDYVTKDVVKRYSTRQGNQTLAKDKILMIVETLHSEDNLRIMPPHVIGYAAKATVKYPEDSELDPKLIQLLTPYLIEHALNLKGSIVTKETEGLLRHVVWPLYGFVQRLLSLDRKDEALALFQELIDKKFIPSSAMQGLDLTSQDVTYIMVRTMVQACLRYDWQLQARNLLRQILDTREVIHPVLIEQIYEIMWWSLDRDFQSDFEAVSSMLSSLFSKPQMPMVPEEMLVKFYKRAKARNAGAHAEKIYELSTSPAVTERQAYQPPSGPALLWFLEYCVFTSKNFRIARSLAVRVVEDDINVPSHDKPLVVATIASVGFAGQARELWERYTQREGAQLVFGNAQTMLRIVSLFSHLIRRGQDMVEQLKQRQQEVEGKALVFSETPGVRSHGKEKKDLFRNDFSRSKFKHDRDIDESEDEEALTDLTETLPEDELVDAEHDFYPKRHRTPQVSVDVEATQETVERWEGRLTDFRAFTDHVIDKFEQMRIPLHKANHYDLNALARAYFILGRTMDGFRMFKIILARKEVPDICDVNVALSAMAMQSPSQAANMIERMVKRGLQPDAVSFGTIIHHAIFQRDMPLVAKLIVRARELGVKQLSYKTMGSLIRATVSTLYEDHNVASEQLENAKDLVDSLQGAGYVPSVRMALDCVITATRAEDPAMAFRFWKFFLKDKAHWGDEQQEATRTKIARLIRHHRARKWLDVNYANVMLSELGEEVSLHAERRGRGRPKKAEKEFLAAEAPSQGEDRTTRLKRNASATSSSRTKGEEH
ncbi:unnamed protein product [Somion occarium]|uniref:Pentatricopeptide repeat-containing protein n=1 Tax=Somion occarium TaxID=3059160 RepID=A0ABP1DXS0_9APHY